MSSSVSKRLSRGGRSAPTITPLSAIRARSTKVANLWIFESPKNKTRLIISGDVPFMHFVLLEGDIDVDGYDLVHDPFGLAPEKQELAEPGYVRVRFVDGREEWCRYSRSRKGKQAATSKELSVLRAAAEAAGATFRELTELDLAGKDILLDNWLTLCAIATRAKAHSLYEETRLLWNHFDRHTVVRVESLLTLPEIDHALMLAAIAKALQSGKIYTNLSGRYFGQDSELKRVQQ